MLFTTQHSRHPSLLLTNTAQCSLVLKGDKNGIVTNILQTFAVMFFSCRRYRRSRVARNQCFLYKHGKSCSPATRRPPLKSQSHASKHGVMACLAASDFLFHSTTNENVPVVIGRVDERLSIARSVTQVGPLRQSRPRDPEGTASGE